LKGSLRNKIIAWSFVPTAIILVAVALVSLHTYRRVTETLVIDRDRELTRLSASLLASELAAYTDPLADQYLAIFDGIVAFDAAGKILFAEPMRYETIGSNWLPGIFSRQIGVSEPIYSDIMVDRQYDEQLVVVVMPVEGSDDRAQGGIAGFFRLDPAAGSALFDSLEELRRGESNSIYLVDGSGQVIYHTNPIYIGQDFSAQAVVELVLDGHAGAYRTRDFQDRDIVASFAPVPGTPWGLVTEESWATLTESSRPYERLLLTLLALGILVPMLVVTFGVRHITRPITDLIHAAQDVASGHFGRRIQASTGDEVEELAQQFNLMAAQLQESYAHLEQKVADRTKELATLNTIAAEVSQSLNLEQILSNALKEVMDVMDMESGQAFRLDGETQTPSGLVHRGWSDRFIHQREHLPVAYSLAREATAERRPIARRVTDYPDAELRSLLQREGLRLVASVPLVVHGRSVGAMNLGSSGSRSVLPEELSLLAAIGHQIGVAVENAGLYEQAQELAVMKERNRLARDLHDSVTQALYGVTLYATAAARQLLAGDLDLAGNHLCEISRTAQESLREMRLLIFELRLPMLKEEGLVAALQARLEAVEARAGLETTLRAEGDGALPPSVEEGLYRVAQEALNNSLRHAHARCVTVRLHRNKEMVALEISDDGIGFDPTAIRDQGGFGLCSMEERAASLGGHLSVQSSPGNGTRILVEVSC
jgi:nitrate/nitrite-specific signal transduction histidine kinase